MEPIGAVYRFYLNEWHKVMVPTGLSPLEAYTVPGFEGLQELPSANTPFGEMNDLLETTFMRGLIFNKTTFTTDEAYQLEELFIRDVYVYAEAMSAEAVKAGDTAFVSAMKSLRDDSVGFLLANDIRDAPSDTDATQHIQQFMINYFDAVTQWTTVMKITTSEIKIEYAMFNISCNLNFTSVTVTVPQDRGQLYRILDEVNGELVEQDTAWSGSGGGFLSPESVPPEPAASRIVDTSQNLGLANLENAQKTTLALQPRPGYPTWYSVLGDVSRRLTGGIIPAWRQEYQASQGCFTETPRLSRYDHGPARS